MRHQPARIGRITREAAADMVVDAALADIIERQQHGVAHTRVFGPLPAAPQQVEQRRLRKFGRLADAAMDAVDRAQHSLGHARAEIFGNRVARLGRGQLLQLRAQLFDVGLHLGLVARIDLGNAFEHLGEGGPAPARFRREIGSAPEGLARRRQEHGQRPAALLAQEHERVLVDGVEIGALLAVDLDVNETRVHQLGDAGVLETLMRHDMAPMAGGIAHRQQDRLVLGFRLVERGLSPGLPMHRIVAVLQEIGAGLPVEVVAAHSGSKLAPKMPGSGPQR